MVGRKKDKNLLGEQKIPTPLRFHHALMRDDKASPTTEWIGIGVGAFIFIVIALIIFLSHPHESVTKSPT